MEIRLAMISDLYDIVNIYNQAVRSRRATADLQEISYDQRIDWFNQHDRNIYPIYVAIIDNKVVGWCSISPYRPGREAVKQTAEISYYVDYNCHGNGIGTALISHAINDTGRIGIKNLFALILEWNESSIRLVKKLGFIQWGFMPGIAVFDGLECGHCIYGLRIN